MTKAKELKLTIKQEAFARAYVETGNASEAYRRAYNAENMQQMTVTKRASELLARGDIGGMVKTIKDKIAAQNLVTVDSLVHELEEARIAALTAESPQSLKNVMRAAPGWQELPNDMRESLEMVAHKVARILNGSPDHVDSWHDIAGYVALVEKRLNGEVV